MLWAKRAGGSVTDVVTGIATDADGNVYINGHTWGFGENVTATFGATSLHAKGNNTLKYIAKYDKDGNILWAKQAGEGNWQYAKGTAVSKDGHLYMTGFFHGDVTMDSQRLSSQGEQDAFVSKYDANGNLVWVKQSNGNKNTASIDLAVDADNNCFIVGGFNGEVDFGAVHLVTTNHELLQDGFITKYDANGNVIWAKKLGGRADDVASSVATDEAGNICVAGQFREDAVFGSLAVSAKIKNLEFSDSFLARYDQDGEAIWVRQASGSTGYHYKVKRVTTDTRGVIYALGQFEGTIHLGSHKVEANINNMFLSAYNANGDALGVVRAGGVGMDVVTDINDNVYLVGQTLGDNVDFGGAMQLKNSSRYGNDTFISKLSGAHTSLFPTVAAGAVADQVYCNGSALTIPFTVSGTFYEGNTFAAQLSDASGVFDAATTIGTGTTSPISASIPVGTLPGNGYRIRIVASSPYITGTPSSASLQIGSTLPQPGTISGSANLCAGEAALTYAVIPASGATSYTWTVPSGWTIVGGAGTPSIQVMAGTQAGYIAVAAINSCGTSAARTLFVNTALPAAPTVRVDAAAAYNQYTLTAAGALEGAFYYWYAAATGGVPLYRGATFTTPLLTASTTYYAAVATAGGCESARTAVTVTINLTPAQPGAISANRAPVCRGTQVQYSVADVAGATSYYWEVPAGWEIVYGQGGSFIAAVAGVEAGTVSVRASNPYGASPAQTLAVVVDAPAAPPAVIGATGCVGSSVTLQASGAWTEYAYYWYTSATGNDYIAKGASFTTPPLTTTTTYYVSRFEKVGGCESLRAAVTATITSAATAKAGPDETVCVGAQSFVLRGYSPAGGEWSGVGVAANGEFNPSAAGVGVHTLTYSFPQNSCLASATKTILVTPGPALTLAPYGEVCSTVRDFDLLKGQPVGGAFSGTGVDSIWFDATVAGVGTHLITYTYNFDGGCTVSTTQAITVTTCTGLPESKLAAKLVVYPNPTRSDINIALPLSKGTAIILRLFNAKGQKVYEQQYPKLSGEFRQIVSLKNKPKGVYLLQLILDDGVVTKRVVVQ